MNDQNDHDLLIQIATKLDRAILDIKELKDNTTARVTALEEEKVSQRDFNVLVKLVEDDHESRIRRLERWGLMAIGALSLLELLISLYQLLHQ